MIRKFILWFFSLTILYVIVTSLVLEKYTLNIPYVLDARIIDGSMRIVMKVVEVRVTGNVFASSSAKHKHIGTTLYSSESIAVDSQRSGSKTVDFYKVGVNRSEVFIATQNTEHPNRIIVNGGSCEKFVGSCAESSKIYECYEKIENTEQVMAEVVGESISITSSSYADAETKSVRYILNDDNPHNTELLIKKRNLQKGVEACI